jgi:SpoVK/Ycf46/Vps4 family AAA+-type ATPase
MTEDFRNRNLVVNERLEEYDGTTAVVRTEELAPEEIEFLRWRKERWMKLAHFPKAVWQSPGFVFRHGLKMLKHTFRGCTMRTLLGLENEREAFRRYCALRAQEREYV